MSPQNLFVVTLGICLMNGLFSPMVAVMWVLHPVWMPELLPLTNETVFYGASLMVATGTLLLSAIPAAVAERFGMPLERAMWLWPAAAATLLLLGWG